MEFCVVAQGQKEAKLLPQAEFERLMQIQYVPGLVFADGGVLETAMRRSERAVKKGWLTQKQQWLSVFYAKEIR